MQNKRLLVLFLILSTAFFIYSTSLRNKFIWDDFHLIANNEDIRSFKNVPVAFKKHLFQELGGSNFYRPIQTVSFMVDYALWKSNQVGYHMTNLLFHLLNVALIYFFVSRISKNRDIGILTSMIFAIHPINTEAVTYISGRADPLSAFFFLAAFMFYIRFKDRKKIIFSFISVSLFAFSLLTKEAVLIFPLVLIFYDAMISEKDKVDATAVRSYVPYFLVLFVYLFYRFFVLGIPFRFLDNIAFDIYILTTIKIVVLYLGLLFFPLNLHMERIEPLAASIFEPQVFVSFITVLCIIPLSIIAYRRSRVLFFL
jgi:protein O-mannosyl-transferase